MIAWDEISTRRMIRALAAAAVLAIPLRVVGLGFLPPDDALVQAARAVTNRPWADVLVFRPDLVNAPFPSWHGWHFVLRALHLATGADALALVLFSVVAMFAVMSLPALALMRRPEAWLLSLLVMIVADPILPVRYFQGRPMMIAVAALVTICLTWERLREPRADRRYLGLVAGLMTASAWFHGAWYLFILLISAFAIAREWTAARRLAAMLAVGAVAGYVLSGHPLTLPYQNLLHAFVTISRPMGAKVAELQPFLGAPEMVVPVLGMLAWRALRGRWDRSVVDNPVFAMMVLCWALGFVAIRFYMDWAVPAALVWMAGEFQAAMEDRPTSNRFQLGLAAASALVCILAYTADLPPGRWSYKGDRIFLSRENPVHAPCLPDDGGILYSNEMDTFYQTYFRNPTGPWKYMLGFEPSMMPAEDAETYDKIRLGAPPEVAYLPWVRKMGTADRLIIRSATPAPPPVPGMQWYQPLYSIWCGRVSPS